MADTDHSAGLVETLRLKRSRFTRGLLAENTQNGYRYDWADFLRFVERVETQALPATPDAVSLYVTDLLARGKKVSTVTRRAAAVAYVHRAHGFASPVTEEVRDVLLGARRQRAEQTKRVRPLTIEHVRGIAKLLIEEGTAIAMRNRALVIVGFASALRSANLSALQLGDVELTEQGAVLRIGRSKTDQEGRGRLIGLPPGEHAETCPVKCLAAWIERRGTFPGPLFTRLDHNRGWKTRPLQPERISQIVQQCVRQLGLDARLYGSHSMRAGMVTEAGKRCGELLIAATTGHRDMACLREYFRPDLWGANASGMLGL